MSFQRIPHELRSYGQWVLWRLEWRSDDPDHLLKPTKIPYQPRLNGGKASVTAPNTWGTFEAACSAPMTCKEPVDHDTPLELSGYSGIGFVFADTDPFCGIDLDNTHGNDAAARDQQEIFRLFDSYSEVSPSGTGVHIIIKGKLPGKGARRHFVEVYDRERFFTFTGDVMIGRENHGVEERQLVLNELYKDMGKEPVEFDPRVDQPQVETDEQIIMRARNASNGEKFNQLYSGNWRLAIVDKADQSQSIADFALIDIVGFYTNNKAQVLRIFRNSQLGQRDKAKRDNYLMPMVERSFDRKLPPLDIEGIRIKYERDSAARAAERQAQAAAQSNVVQLRPYAQEVPQSAPVAAPMFPPGLVGELAEFILAQAPRPVPVVALAGAIGLLSGMCGKAYNVSGQGLNQYILLLARTGIGKDAISSGISKVMTQVIKSQGAAVQFIGPSELVSAPGLQKVFTDKPCCLSVVGEFGLKMKEMASPTANAHVTGLQRMLLQLYTKGGHGEILGASAYSDKANNTGPIAGASFTLIGESVPEKFYEALDDGMIASGLLPRFLTYEYLGDRKLLNKMAFTAQPSMRLVEQLANLAAQCLNVGNSGRVHHVPLDDEAQHAFDELDAWTTKLMNENKGNNVLAELWNRAHIKALKLAAVVAIGQNWLNPIVTINEAMWAINMVVEQTHKMLAKFENDEVGGSNPGTVEDNKQHNEIMKVVGRYMREHWLDCQKYGGTEEMHRDGVILHSHIQRRVYNLACFKHDRYGVVVALKRAITNMLEIGELREMPKDQMLQKYGNNGKAYVVAQPTPFIDAYQKWLAAKEAK